MLSTAEYMASSLRRTLHRSQQKSTIHGYEP